MFTRVIGYWLVCDQAKCKEQQFILPPKSVVHRKAYAEREAHARGWEIGPGDKVLCRKHALEAVSASAGVPHSA